MATAYREPDEKHGKFLLQSVVDSLPTGLLDGFDKLRPLCRTLKQCAADIPAFFDRPGTSNGPSQAPSGSIEQLRDAALGFQNQTNYIARSLRGTGGFRNHPHPQMD